MGLRTSVAHDRAMRLTVPSLVLLCTPQVHAGGDITVRVVGDADTRLEEATIGSDATVHWETACIAPCFTHIARHALVRANASLPSAPLELGDEDAIVRVERGKADGGASNVLIGVGATLLGVGGVIAPVAATFVVEQSIVFCF